MGSGNPRRGLAAAAPAINLTPNGTPSIMLADADKTVRAGTALKDDGSPLVMPAKAP
jgi:hypothetical protein